jgi:hypothetical protein
VAASTRCALNFNSSATCQDGADSLRRGSHVLGLMRYLRLYHSWLSQQAVVVVAKPYASYQWTLA